MPADLPATRSARAWPNGRPRAFAFLPRFLFSAATPVWRYVLLGWPVVALPTLALGWVASKLAPDLAGPQLGGAPAWMIVFGVVVISPLLETLVMTAPVALLDRLFGPIAAAIGSALLWAGAHSLAAARWGLVIWWPFLLFSIAYLTWRERGYWRAVGVVFALHALNNGGPIVVALLLQ